MIIKKVPAQSLILSPTHRLTLTPTSENRQRDVDAGQLHDMVKNAGIEHTLGMKKALRVEAVLERALRKEKGRVEELQLQLNTTMADKVVLERERKRGEYPDGQPKPKPIP